MTLSSMAACVVMHANLPIGNDDTAVSCLGIAADPAVSVKGLLFWKMDCQPASPVPPPFTVSCISPHDLVTPPDSCPTGFQELARRTDTLIRLVEKEHEENELLEAEERRRFTKKPTSTSRGGGAAATAAPASANGDPGVAPSAAKKRRAGPAGERPGKRRGAAAAAAT